MLLVLFLLLPVLMLLLLLVLLLLLLLLLRLVVLMLLRLLLPESLPQLVVYGCHRHCCFCVVGRAPDLAPFVPVRGPGLAQRLARTAARALGDVVFEILCLAQPECRARPWPCRVAMLVILLLPLLLPMIVAHTFLLPPCLVRAFCIAPCSWACSCSGSRSCSCACCRPFPAQACAPAARRCFCFCSCTPLPASAFVFLQDTLVWLRPDVVPRCFLVLFLLAPGLVTRRIHDSRLDVSSMLAPTVRHIPTFQSLLIVMRPLKLSLRVLLALVLVFQVGSPLLFLFASAHFFVCTTRAPSAL